MLKEKTPSLLGLPELAFPPPPENWGDLRGDGYVPLSPRAPPVPRALRAMDEKLRSPDQTRVAASGPAGVDRNLTTCCNSDPT